MVEHFQNVSRHKIGGRAKAMVVTGSRLEAVRYKQAFDQMIAQKGYAIKTLVAFSGQVPDDKLPDKTYTEVEMNGGIREKDLPAEFATQEYQVLLVAEKYQTGFDQPLLHTMYVDKRLAGIQAVQTLSRLNRTHPLKEETFVLDFVNDPEEIREAFKTYFDGATMGDDVDPDRLYEVKGELDASGLYLDPEVTQFCLVFFAPKQRQSPSDHKTMNAVLDKAVARFQTLLDESEEEAELWRGKVQAFRNLYVFLSQVIPYQDSDLEKLYTYLQHLALKLPKRKSGPNYQFDDDVQLQYYRLQKISEGSINLAEGYTSAIEGPKELGSGRVREEHVPLSRLIDLLNERFGEDLNEADQLFFDQIAEAAAQIEAISQAAQANPYDKFQLVFGQILESIFIERMDLNEDLFARYMNDPEFKQLVSEWLGQQVYSRIPKTMSYRA
jgi:type I restriction enzyme R subunit